MTKVMIIGDMTLGESAPPGPVYPGQPLPQPQPPGGVVRPPIELPPGIDNSLPPIPGQGLPPPDLLPGEIWPPLKPGEPAPKKAYAIVAIPGVGYRYTVVDLSLHPDQGLPGRPGRPDRPDQGLPPTPGHPGQPLPPDHGRPDQGLPEHPEPKPSHR